MIFLMDSPAKGSNNPKQMTSPLLPDSLNVCAILNLTPFPCFTLNLIPADFIFPTLSCIHALVTILVSPVLGFSGQNAYYSLMTVCLFSDING